jgi:hypothetical protein
MGHLRHHLDRSIPYEVTRWKSGAVRSDKVRGLAEIWKRRNKIVHRTGYCEGVGRSARSPSSFSLHRTSAPAHLTEWGRESQALRELAAGPRRSIDVQPP